MTLLETLRAFLRTRDAPTFLVGGTVRDLLLGRAIHDADVVVQGDASALARAFADKIGAAFYVMDEAFDVARVIWDRAGAREIADFARMRGGSIVQDLQTRDFTVNAMAVDAVHWQGDAAAVIDPFGALNDLAARRLRAVSDMVFRSDAVRLARAVRLEAELDFSADEATARWIARDASLIQRAPMERVRDELMRTLGADRVLTALRRLDAFALLGYILPEVEALRGVTQSPPHIYDALEHSLRAVAAAAETERAGYADLAEGAYDARLAAHFAGTVGVYTRREMLRLTLLLHDIGKPAARTVEPSGRIRFLGHEAQGVALVVPALRRLRFSVEQIHWVKTIVANHLRPILLAQNGASRRALYRYFRATGDAGVDTAIHAWCDQRATYGETMPPEVAAAQQATLARLLETYYHAHAQMVAPRPLVDGNAVMQALGLPPGPAVRAALEAALEAQALGEITTRDEALAFLKRRQRGD